MTRYFCVLAGAWVAATLAFGQAPPPPAAPAKPAQTFPAELVKAGENLFVQDCAFCHGRDTGGGESGPDLTRSKIVADDVDGNQLGRTGLGEPARQSDDLGVAGAAVQGDDDAVERGDLGFGHGGYDTTARAQASGASE